MQVVDSRGKVAFFSMKGVTGAVAERMLRRGPKAAFYLCVIYVEKNPSEIKTKTAAGFSEKFRPQIPSAPEPLCAWSVVEGQGDRSSGGTSGVPTAVLSLLPLIF